MQQWTITTLTGTAGSHRGASGASRSRRGQNRSKLGWKYVVEIAAAPIVHLYKDKSFIQQERRYLPKV